jgi:hypothetical protein
MRVRAVAVRVAVSAVLVATAVLLMTEFGEMGQTPRPALMHFPGGAELAADYQSLVGSKVELYGRVISTEPVVVRGEYGGTDLSVRVVSVAGEPSVGQYLHVFGVVQQDGSIAAIDIVTYPESGIGFTYAVSGLAGVWSVARFLNRWQLDFDGAAFVPRGAPRFGVFDDESGIETEGDDA